MAVQSRPFQGCYPLPEIAPALLGPGNIVVSPACVVLVPEEVVVLCIDHRTCVLFGWAKVYPSTHQKKKTKKKVVLPDAHTALYFQ